MRDLVLLALIAVVAAPAAAQTSRGPDAHIVRPPRGDPMDVRGEPASCLRNGGGVYVAPYRGWRYKAVARGERLKPVFYQPRYAIADRKRHGLAAPGRHGRWIRYGDDAVLVDLRTGRILQIIADRCR